MADERRLRILRVKDFFEEYTDEDHSAMMNGIVQYLKKYGIEAERRSIIEDIDALNHYGMDIKLDENGKSRKSLDREFEISEIRMLVDCIASSKFLSEEKSKALIDKLLKLLSLYQRNKIIRRVELSYLKKSTNKSVLYNIDTIHEAIAKFKNIEFQYYQYNMKKERELKDQGKVYIADPRRLFYDNNYCYCLIEQNDKSKVLRVDKMTNVRISNSYVPNRLNKLPEELIGFRNRFYTESIWEIEKESKTVQILFSKKMMDTVIDRFGEDVSTEIVDADHFRVKVDVVPDFQFFSWIFELGDKAMIEYPLSVAAQMMDMLKERFKAYREEHSSNIYYYRRKKNKTDQGE